MLNCQGTCSHAQCDMSMCIRCALERTTIFFVHGIIVWKNSKKMVIASLQNYNLPADLNLSGILDNLERYYVVFT